MSNLKEIYEKSMKVEKEKIDKEMAEKAQKEQELEMLKKGVKRLAEILTDAGFRATTEAMPVPGMYGHKMDLTISVGNECSIFFFEIATGERLSSMKSHCEQATWGAWLKSFTQERTIREPTMMLSYAHEAYDMDSEADIRKLAGEIVEDFGSEIARKRMVTRQP